MRNEDYGVFPGQPIDPETQQSSSREWRLLPSRLPSIEALQASYPTESYQALSEVRHAVHSLFLQNFISTEYEPGYTIDPEELLYLREQLRGFRVASSAIDEVVPQNGRHLIIERSENERRTRLQSPPPPLLYGDGAEDQDRAATSQTVIEREETEGDTESQFSWRSGNGTRRQGEELLSLVYRISEDQARKQNYVHMGIQCDSCGVQPIQGIRYRCANCPDFDVCEVCEAQQPHIMTHIFYKVRIPVPSLSLRQGISPPWYPGKPNSLPRSVPYDLKKRLSDDTNFDSPELDAYWDQFRCLAGCAWPDDPNRLGMGIDRAIFDQCMVRTSSQRLSPPNLIWDRLFAFYDTNEDGIIGFEEFVVGLDKLHTKSRSQRLRKIFCGFDLDKDGYVSRKDFLRMFRAYYAHHKESAREMVAAMEDDSAEAARDVVHSSQPLSSAFSVPIPPGPSSRDGAGKQPDADGDLKIVDNQGVLNDDDEEIGDRTRTIVEAAVANRGNFSFPDNFSFLTPLVDDSDTPLHTYEWPPPNEVTEDDVTEALGCNVPLEEIMDPVDRSRVLFVHSQRLCARLESDLQNARTRAVNERWQKRRFYTDVEEGASAPPGYTEGDSSDEEGHGMNGMLSPVSASDSRRPSLRSRSSSKVRFEDSVTDTDYETRSNTSSRSIPVGERWGGYEIPEPEKDLGKEALYQAVQEGFNELLDRLFKRDEDLAIEADATRADRQKWADQIREYRASVDKEGSGQPQPAELVEEPSPSSSRAATIGTTPSISRTTTIARTAPNQSTRGLTHISEEAEEDGEILRCAQILRESGEIVESPCSPTTVDPTFHHNIPYEASASPSQPPSTQSPHQEQTTPPATVRVQLSADGSDPSPPRHHNPESDPDTTPRKPSSQAEPPSAPSSSSPSEAHATSNLPHENQPSRETLEKWVEHDEIDATAKRRGGHGKIGFDQFRERMVADAERSKSGERGKHRDKEKSPWDVEAGSGLGRLRFVEGWLDMGIF